MSSCGSMVEVVEGILSVVVGYKASSAYSRNPRLHAPEGYSADQAKARHAAVIDFQNCLTYPVTSEVYVCFRHGFLKEEVFI
jgi:hypothetical protein